MGSIKFILDLIINFAEMYSKPLIEALDNEASFCRLFSQLGWDVDDSADLGEIFLLFSDLKNEITNLDSLVTELKNISEASDPLELLDEIKPVSKSLQSILGPIAGDLKDIKNRYQTSWPSPFNNNDLWETLIEDLFAYLTYQYLKDNNKPLLGFLQFTGLISEEAIKSPVPPRFRYTKYELHWGNIIKLVDPPKILEDIYGWGNSFDYHLFLINLSALFRNYGLSSKLFPASPAQLDLYYGASADIRTRIGELVVPVYTAIYDNGSALAMIEFNLDMIPIPPVADNTANPNGFAMLLNLKGTSNATFNINDGISVELKGGFETDQGIGVEIRPEGIRGKASAASQLDALAKVTVKPVDKPSWILFGSKESTRLELSQIHMALAAKGNVDPAYENPFKDVEYVIEFGFDKASCIIDFGEGDGFLQKMLGGKSQSLDFGLSMQWSNRTGFRFSGQEKLSLTIPIHLNIANILKLESLDLSLQSNDTDNNSNLNIGITGGLNLGPISASVMNVGLKMIVAHKPSGGNLGDLDLQFGFKPPDGIGLSIDAGVVKGGGLLLFDTENSRYAGAMELSIQDTLQIAAICVITTKMPDGSKGFSLLIIVSVTFEPGIALGMGFFLSGLGGMLGLNETVNVDALCEGVRNNALDNILFPENVVENINSIIVRVVEIFPPKRDQFFIGLMARITWGTPALVYLDFGVAIEFSDPVRLAILGVLKLTLPTEDNAILHIQVNFVGILDFKKKWLSFDASLYNSFILTFTLEGDMALRLSWGEEKGFLMSVGGFHPAFTPPAALRVPDLKRLTLTIYKDNPRLVLTSYFAITSNTVQFGARIDFLFKLSKFSVVGFLAFDALFQFSPFRFIVNISAGLEVKVGDTSLLSISLDFELSGTTPWHAKGKASFSILFFEVKVRFDKEWGDTNSIEEPSIAILPASLDAFSADANWVSEIPPNKSLLVSLKDIKQELGQIVLQPHGSFKVSQTVIPLGITLEKFGNAIPSDINRLEVNEVLIGGQSVKGEDSSEFFAPSMFREMEDMDKLKSASYEKMNGGIKITETNNIELVSRINRLIEYEVSSSDSFADSSKQKMTFNTEMIKRMTKGGVISASELGKEYSRNKFKNIGGSVELDDEKYVVVNKSDLEIVPSDKFVAGSYTEAQEHMKDQLTKNPDLTDKIKIIPAYHLEMA